MTYHSLHCSICPAILVIPIQPGTTKLELDMLIYDRGWAYRLSEWAVEATAKLTCPECLAVLD